VKSSFNIGSSGVALGVLRVSLIRFGVWCAARRLNLGSFEWPRSAASATSPMTLTQDQFDALVLGLPWQRLEQLRRITRM